MRWSSTKRPEEELKEHRDHLEELVEERTSKLVQVNRGLETEISERRRADEARMKAEADLRSFLDHVDDMVYYRAKDGRLTDLNDAYITVTGYSADEFDSDTELWRNIMHPDDRKATEDFFSMHPDGVPSHEYDYRLRTKAGEWRWLHSHMVGVRNSEGKFIGYNCIDRDITARKEAERRLQVSFDRLERSFRGTVFTISRIVEARDPYTSGHQLRTAELARFIAEEMELSEEQVQGIYLAAVVHDIGKIRVPQEYLSRPGKLSEIELRVIRAHPQISYDILKTIEFPWPIADFVLQHHERLDGSGYPNGLKGDKIFMEARILAVADVIEAMATHRPYRAALTIETALDEIQSNRGDKYDSQVVDACLKVFKENKFDLDKI